MCRVWRCQPLKKISLQTKSSHWNRLRRVKARGCLHQQWIWGLLTRVLKHHDLAWGQQEPRLGRHIQGGGLGYWQRELLSNISTYQSWTRNKTIWTSRGLEMSRSERLLRYFSWMVTSLKKEKDSPHPPYNSENAFLFLNAWYCQDSTWSKLYCRKYLSFSWMLCRCDSLCRNAHICLSVTLFENYRISTRSYVKW